jgi:hypothetical protein
MSVAWLAVAALVQGGGWTMWPPRPSVGDTVWLERVVPAPAGWRVRPGRLPTHEDYDQLTDPLILRSGGAWVVRYAVVMWRTGTVTVAPPPVWRLGPDGAADSLENTALGIAVRSVIPDSITAPVPRPALAPTWPEVRRPLAPGLAALVAAVALAGGIAFRRRRPRRLAPLRAAAPVKPVHDERWIEAGEPRAVAARASVALRAALARAVPAAHAGLSRVEALAAAAPELPQTFQRDLADVLTALDHVGFAAVHGAEVQGLAERARALAAEMAP